MHGKGSLLAKMPGDDWQRFANLRLLLGWQYATPGKKLVFMGTELAPWTEWNHDDGLPWHLTNQASHEGVLQWMATLNQLYSTIPALHRLDTDPAGFEWIDGADSERSIFTLVRSDGDGDMVVAAMNATPVPRHDVMTGVPAPGTWNVVACSDEGRFGGSDYEQTKSYTTTSDAHNQFDQALWLTLPPLSITLVRYQGVKLA